MPIIPLIFLLSIGWYRYFVLKSPSSLFLLFLIVFSTIIAFMVRKGIRKAAAANNIVAAAATFNTLNQSEQQHVHQNTIAIMNRSGIRMREEKLYFRNAAERYGWYALSMAELGIKPVCIGWQFISNPSIAISINDSLIDTALQKAKKQGFDVRISRDSEF